MRGRGKRKIGAFLLLLCLMGAAEFIQAGEEGKVNLEALSRAAEDLTRSFPGQYEGYLMTRMILLTWKRWRLSGRVRNNF